MKVKKLTTADKKRSVKGLLVDAGIKQVEIARACKVSSALVSGVVSKKKRSARVELAIARALGLKVEAIFPRNNNHREAA